jgi:hypothetical protein
MPTKARGTIRGSNFYPAYRLICGIALLILGAYQYSLGPAYVQMALISFVIGGLMTTFGIFGFLFRKKIGSALEIDSPTPTERLAEATRLRQEGIISQTEYEAKRQQILRDI